MVWAGDIDQALSSALSLIGWFLVGHKQLVFGQHGEMFGIQCQQYTPGRQGCCGDERVIQTRAMGAPPVAPQQAALSRNGRAQVDVQKGVQQQRQCLALGPFTHAHVKFGHGHSADGTVRW